MEISINDLMCAFEETYSLSMRSVDLCLTYIHYLRIFVEFRVVESRLDTQHNRWTIFDSKQLLQSQLHCPQLSPYKPSLVIKIIQIKLSFLQHLFLRTLINLQLTTHSINQNIQRFVHLFDWLEVTGFELFQWILSEKQRLFISVELVLFWDVSFDNGRVALVEISQDF